MLLSFPLDISCAECAAQTIEIHVDLHQAPNEEAVGLHEMIDPSSVAVEARCPTCGNHVIFGDVPVRIET